MDITFRRGHIWFNIYYFGMLNSALLIDQAIVLQVVKTVTYHYPQYHYCAIINIYHMGTTFPSQVPGARACATPTHICTLYTINKKSDPFTQSSSIEYFRIYEIQLTASFFLMLNLFLRLK